jgi:hypothetical protein
MNQKQLPLPPSVLFPYTGGHTSIDGGYIFELCPDHPKANQWVFVPQHRLVVERKLGHYLPPGFDMHHKDRVKTNNDPDNLEVLTRSEHMKRHREEKRLMSKAPLVEDDVRAALQAVGLKKAAALLGVHQQTLRNRFPDLVAPYKRRSPTRIDDPVAVEKVLSVVPNDKKGYRDVALETGFSYSTVWRICERNGVPWLRKSKKGEKHRKRPGQLLPDAHRGAANLAGPARERRSRAYRLGSRPGCWGYRPCAEDG